MPKANRSPRDVAAEITDLIIRKLEEGVPPWSRPWRSSGGGRPLRHCGTPYSGINNLYLWAVGDHRGYRSRYWMTCRQAEALGGQVRKDETGSLSVYYSSFTKLAADPGTGRETERTIRFLRHYLVFNADQIDGLPATYHVEDKPEIEPSPSHRQRAIDAFFAAIPADVRHGGNQAYFTPTFDFIQMPHRRSFRSMDLYASTRCHETIHWSGHASRLARTFGKRFGDKAYAFEELVAEIGAGLCCADLRLPNHLHDGHASYVGQWLSILRADKTAIIHAASKAEQALTYLKAFGPERPSGEAVPAAAEAQGAATA
ncbi:MAG: zincin-like metallopeptidase domain-containing protein [Sphingobium sp.]|uniref:ArdC family protein n=1 Tax=Sphingobium sp. TaxID=1912891 RepID=UPI0029B381ED|nr:zincin-like metallopeptidase domain-containing protein [Sphingobium sp.]MDX3911142.1 zincin-like metallopeptidase domain-containing protein [Sphingobium sp.]